MDYNDTWSFSTPESMLKTIQDGIDLYSPSLCIYVFGYNDMGSICAYYITNDEAEKLSQNDEYWGAYLGPGGQIYDTVEWQKDCYGDGEYEDMALEFCKDTYMMKDWIPAEYAGWEV